MRFSWLTQICQENLKISVFETKSFSIEKMKENYTRREYRRNLLDISIGFE